MALEVGSGTHRMFATTGNQVGNGRAASRLTGEPVGSNGCAGDEPIESDAQPRRREAMFAEECRNGTVMLNSISENSRLGSDQDEELGLDDPNLGYEIGMDPDIGNESDEDESTAGEGGDTLPNETTTTDTVPELHEPLDYIESRPRTTLAPPTSHNGTGPAHQYENVSINEDGSRRAKAPKRPSKVVSRLVAKERQRAPHPLPRQVKAKLQHPRPSPIRKRRPSGRMLRPLSHASEGDMAQADEMGDGDGEGRDDGFVDCLSNETLKKRCKKRSPGGALLPSMGNGSPPSSPSNTPIARRRTSSRKSRPKPRQRKSTKQSVPPSLAPADISTQETTTPGPDTTDDSSNELQQPSQAAGHDVMEEQPLDLDDHFSSEDARSGTPGLTGAGPPRSDSCDPLEECDDGQRSDRDLAGGGGAAAALPGANSRGNLVSDLAPDSLPCSSLRRSHECSPDVSPVLRHPGTSPPEDNPLGTGRGSTQPTPPLRQAWQRWESSDPSAVPLSSETSDFETSGTEPAHTDGGSTSDLSSGVADRAKLSSPRLPLSGQGGRGRGGGGGEGGGEESPIKPRPPVGRKPLSLPPKKPPYRHSLYSSVSTPEFLERPAIPTKPPIKDHSVSITNHSVPNSKYSVPPSLKPKPKPPLKPKPLSVSNLDPPPHRARPPSSSQTNHSGHYKSLPLSGTQKSNPITTERREPPVSSKPHRATIQSSQSDVQLCSRQETASSVPNGQPPLRRGKSDTSLMEPAKKAPMTPPCKPKRLAKLVEEREERESGEQGQRRLFGDRHPPLPTAAKPSVAVKSRQLSEKRPPVVKQSPPLAMRPVSCIVDLKESGPNSSDSSKTSPSLSSPASSPSASPSPSPAPVPAVKRTPPTAQKPLPPKKPPVLLPVGSAAGGEGGGPRPASGRRDSGNDSEGSLPPVPERPAVSDAGSRPGLRSGSPPRVAGDRPVDEEPPPPAVPKKTNRRSTHIELIIQGSQVGVVPAEGVGMAPEGGVDGVPTTAPASHTSASRELGSGQREQAQAKPGPKTKLSAPRRPPPSPPQEKRDPSAPSRSTTMSGGRSERRGQKEGLKRHSMFTTSNPPPSSPPPPPPSSPPPPPPSSPPPHSSSPLSPSSRGSTRRHHYYEICEPLLSPPHAHHEPAESCSLDAVAPPYYKIPIPSPSVLRAGKRDRPPRSNTPDLAAPSVDRPARNKTPDSLTTARGKSPDRVVPSRPNRPARSRTPDLTAPKKPDRVARSKTPDYFLSDSRPNGEGAESGTTRRYTAGAFRKIAPPKPRKHTDPDETTGYVRYGRAASPPLPPTSSPPLITHQTSVPSLQQASRSPKERRRSKPEPIYDFIRDEDHLPTLHFTRDKDCLPSHDLTQENEAPLPSLTSFFSEVTSLLNIDSTEDYAKAPMALSLVPGPQQGGSGSGTSLQNQGTTENSESLDSPVTSDTSASSSVFRRSNSDRFKKHKVSASEVAVNGTTSMVHLMVHRTPSLDKLDDRMDRTLPRGTTLRNDSSSSEDEEEESGIVSPVMHGLPTPQAQEAPYSTAVSKSLQRKRAGRSESFPSPLMKPLYQYINTAAFLNARDREALPARATDLKRQGSKTQLEVAQELDSQRRLWCEQQEVIESGVLETLDDEQKNLQEAMFEMITSEATYLRSLNVLIEHFMDDPGMNPNLPEGRRVLDRRQHHVIFSNIREVRDISERFLNGLKKRQRESAVVSNISDIILEYAENNFDCYVRYCSNQIYQTRELTECLEHNVMFCDYLRRLESSKRCQNLSMQSFLLLPMQRITRLPLLILAMLNRTPLDHPDYVHVESTLRTVQKLVTACNDGARKMERTEQLHGIAQKIDFGKKLKPFPIVSVSRQLERKGTLVRLEVEQKLFGKQRIKRTPFYIFVFTDFIIFSHKKKDPRGGYMFKVKDHASRAVVQVEELINHPSVTFPKNAFGEQDPIAMATWAVSTANVKHAFLVILLDNAFHETSRYIFVAQNATDKTRWMEAITRPDLEKEGETIYQHWDCPQVQAVYDYEDQQPDELSLLRGDIIKVYRKMADGWYEGERLRDLQWGWFPSNFTVEVENEHTRARNLRETHKLLSLPFNPEEFSVSFMR